MDTNNAFLCGDLEKDVYMCLSLSFSSSAPNKVCKLHKSLYGLRQASHRWFAKLSSTLLTYGFVRSSANYSLLTYSKGDAFLALFVAVRDIIYIVLAQNNSQACEEFQYCLNNYYHIIYLGPLKYFLGIEVVYG